MPISADEWRRMLESLAVYALSDKLPTTHHSHSSCKHPSLCSTYTHHKLFIRWNTKLPKTVEQPSILMSQLTDHFKHIYGFNISIFMFLMLNYYFQLTIFKL